MDFAKYVALLKSQALYFARLDKLEDTFEGSISKNDYENIIKTAANGEESGILPPDWKGKYFDVLMQSSRNSRRSCYINCWHFNECESEAMWRLYSQSSFAVAIKSTYLKLGNSLSIPSEFRHRCVRPFLGKVTYIDHFKGNLSNNNLLTPAMNKRPSFQHEQECRALIWIPEPDNYVFLKDPDSIFEEYPIGLNINVDLVQLIEFATISPLAPSWFIEVVADINLRYGLQWEIRSSQLSEKPFI